MKSIDRNIFYIIAVLGILSFISIFTSLLVVSGIFQFFNWPNILSKYFRLFFLNDKEIEANLYILLVSIVFPLSFIVYRYSLKFVTKEWEEFSNRLTRLNLRRIIAILTLLIGYIGFFQLFFTIFNDTDVFASISSFLLLFFMLLILPYTDFVLKESSENEIRLEVNTEVEKKVGGRRELFEEKTYVRETVIGALLLIIIALIIKLLSMEVDFLPSWFFENLFLGIFTLSGAYFGAKVAGMYAVKTARMNINENKLWNYEDFRRLLLIYKHDIYTVNRLTELLLNQKLEPSDIEHTQKNIIHHFKVIIENISLNEVPVDYYKKIDLLLKYARQLDTNAFFRNVEFADNVVAFDFKHVQKLNESYKKHIDALYKELNI
ncbi:hypothetical protein [Psychrobacillus sp. FSL K6-2843]|uniref:hypothetical protein n=1 Tax=Psychrobacillus sp. FSL K6-2843 TaxID=2921549 RepID=UPI003159E30D